MFRLYNVPKTIIFGLIMGLVAFFSLGQLLLVPAHAVFQPAASGNAIGDPLPKISCIDGYAATVYYDGLSRPDSLTADGLGGIYVSDEVLGSIFQISNGNASTIASRLNNPEGFAFDVSGNLYVVEDLVNGRLLKIDLNNGGSTTVLLDNLDSPEGLVLGDDGMLYLSTSSADLALQTPPQSEADIQNYRSKILKVDPNLPNVSTALIDTTADYSINYLNQSAIGTFFSYTGLETDANGLIYFTNELSGFDIITTTLAPNPLFPIGPPEIEITGQFTSTESVFILDPNNPPNDPQALPTPFVENLAAPEGIGFSSSGSFPMYVAEAKIPLDGSPQSRLIRVSATGQYDILCEGFDSLEDVVELSSGELIVSEEGTGLLIAISKEDDPSTLPTRTPSPEPTSDGNPIPTGTPIPSPSPALTPVPSLTPDTPGGLDLLTFLPFLFSTGE